MVNGDNHFCRPVERAGMAVALRSPAGADSHQTLRLFLVTGATLIGARGRVVVIFRRRAAVRRLIGAILAKQRDELADGRRYLTAEAPWQLDALRKSH